MFKEGEVVRVVGMDKVLLIMEVGETECLLFDNFNTPCLWWPTYLIRKHEDTRGLLDDGCPSCKEQDDIYYESIEIHGHLAEQNCRCHICGTEWVDIYQLEWRERIN